MTTFQHQDPEEAFADGTPLVELFGKPGRTKLISVFVDERENDLNVSELARQAGVARSTVYDHLDDLVEVVVNCAAGPPACRASSLMLRSFSRSSTNTLMSFVRPGLPKSSTSGVPSANASWESCCRSVAIVESTYLLRSTRHT